MGLWEKVPSGDIGSWTNAVVAYMTPLSLARTLVLHQRTGEIPMEVVVSTEIGILGSLVEVLGKSTDTPHGILSGLQELQALRMYHKEFLQRPDRWPTLGKEHTLWQLATQENYHVLHH